MTAGCASRNRTGVRPFRTELDRDISGSQISDKHRNEKRRNPSVTLFQVGPVVMFNGRKTPHAGTDYNSNPFGIFPGNPETGILNCHCGSGNSQMDKTVHLLYFFGLDVISRLKSLYFSGNAYRQQRRVKMSYRTYTRLPLKRRIPRL